jgi:uncharacterized protein YbbK (DUF523 family)
VKKSILVSACLLGVNCKYNGENNAQKKLIDYFESHPDYCFIPICPEQLGGLPTPRKPCEMQQSSQKVLTQDGEDKTFEYQKGAAEALYIAKLAGAKLAILKEKSPSCGVHFIYDGTFQSIKIAGQGVSAKLLSENGIEIISEEDLDEFNW